VKYVGWTFILVGVIMMLVTGIRASGQSSGLNQANAIVAVVTPWFWLAVAGQVLCYIKVEHLSKIRWMFSYESLMKLKPFLVSWIIQIIGLLLILGIGTIDVFQMSENGEDFDFHFDKIRPIPIIAGVLIIISAKFYFSRNPSDD
jgi:hypothetical protein